MQHRPVFVKDRRSYVTVLPEGGWRHAALVADGVRISDFAV